MKDVLYMGDTSLETAASYLSLILERLELSYDYVASAGTVPDSIAAERYGLYILSDYPAANLPVDFTGEIERRVAEGSGLLMIGGWESYQGQSGGYHGTLIERLLPVEISAEDDRVNSANACCVVPAAAHPVTEGLPFDSPPLVAGYNRFSAKAGSEVVLSLVSFSTAFEGGSTVSFTEIDRAPFLVVGKHGSGITAALASDLAPHWVGGFVDWGAKRVTLSGAGREVEIGDDYLTFVTRLVSWMRPV